MWNPAGAGVCCILAHGVLIVQIALVIRRFDIRTVPFPWIYLAVIAVAELATVLGSPRLGLLLHAGLLVIFTLHGGLGQPGCQRDLVLVLALIPLIRVLSLTLPLAVLPTWAWYAAVALPAIAATWQASRLCRLSRHELGLVRGNGGLGVQMLLGCMGFGLGVLQYHLLKPAPIDGASSAGILLLMALTFIVCTGFAEELVFRGIVLAVARPALGPWAAFYSALLFASMHIGYRSVVDVLLMLAVGYLFAGIVRWSGSIAGVTLAHGLTNVVLFLVMPILATETGAVAVIGPWLLASLSAIGLGSLGIIATPLSRRQLAID